MPKFDEIDEQIVRLLQKDGTMSKLEIAKRLKRSEATERRRRIRLEKENVIRIVGSANPLALGYGTVAIIGVQTENAKLVRVERALKQLPEVHFLQHWHLRPMMEVWLRTNEDVVRSKMVELAKIDGILRLDIFQFVKTVQVLRLDRRTLGHRGQRRCLSKRHQETREGEERKNMRLGFYADYSESVAKFAHEVGFDSMELSAWPNSALDANVATQKAIDAILKDLNSKDIEISALGFYPNYLDSGEGEHDKKYLLKVMDLAKQMGVKTTATFAGRDPTKSIADNLPIFKEEFSRLADEAEKRGVRLAIENCPMMNNKEMKGTLHSQGSPKNGDRADNRVSKLF